jgi:hypothetical protein
LACDREASIAQFIEILSPGGTSVFVRCSSIERVEVSNSLGPDAVAPPETPIRVVLRERGEKLLAYGCSVLDILHGIHRDDAFLDSRGEPPT